MCGFLGIGFNKKARSVENINNALEALFNRGPDSAGVINNKDIIMGHRRLSIIGLSDSGNQPMNSPDGNYTIVFNGEIYNYLDIRKRITLDWQWQSDTDTEVLLAAYIQWGVAAFSKLRGMFAFAIWNQSQKKLILCRDRLGVKPLYYYLSRSNELMFSSRPTSLLKLMYDNKPELDMQSIRYFAEAGYIPAPYTLYQGMHKLKPGHYIEVDENHLRRIRQTKYWSLKSDKRVPTGKMNEELLLDRLDNILTDSVKSRLVSDVQVGCFLSGGYDSSFVAAKMVELIGSNFSAFTIGFHDDDANEAIQAAEIADFLGIKHQIEYLTSNDLLDLFPDFLKNYDEPFFDHSSFAVMAVSRLAGRSVKVALSGDGGDEAFGGYHYYYIMRLFGIFEFIPLVWRKVFTRFFALLPGRKAKLFFNLVKQKNIPGAFAFIRSVLKYNSNIFKADLVNRTIGLSDLFERSAEMIESGLTAAEIGMRLDTLYTLPDDYLQKVDVGSMAFSVEARDPLLDHNLYEWSANLPERWKIGNSVFHWQPKYLFKKLTYRYIPERILNRPKKGFGVPMSKWLRGPLSDWVGDMLNQKDVFESVGIEHRNLLQLWENHRKGISEEATTVWTMAVLASFLRNN